MYLEFLARLGRGAGVAAALLGLALLLWLSLNPKHPLLYALRPLEAPLLIGVGIVGAIWIGSGAARLPLWPGRAAVAALLGVAVTAVGNEETFRRQRAEVLAAPPAARALGERFIVGYRDFAAVAPLAARGLIGGIYLTRRNVGRRDLAAIRAEIDALQALRQQAGLPPLVVAADQEGGSVAHLSPPLPAMPTLAALLAAGSDARLEGRARAYGEVQGRALAALGINMNLGPVVDLRPRRGTVAVDWQTRLGERAIAADAGLVSRVAGAYADGLASQGVTPTLKHFPGLGGVASDTHLAAARLDTAPQLLAASDWQPFRRVGKAPVAIMLGHVVLPALDAERPASLSPAVVQGLLRRDWGFRGRLITDDLNMAAAYRFGICAATLSALAAGVDLLLISYDPDQYFRAMHCAMRAAGPSGEIALSFPPLPLPSPALAPDRHGPDLSIQFHRGNRRRSVAGRYRLSDLVRHDDQVARSPQIGVFVDGRDQPRHPA